MKYILGVDVGGSKTHIAIAASDGTILADSQTTGTIYTDVGIDGVMSLVKDAVGKCLKLAGIAIDDINTGVFGMTGIDWPFELSLHKKALEETFPAIGTVIACNDALVALHAAVKKDWGVILCSELGSTLQRYRQKEIISHLVSMKTLLTAAAKALAAKS